LVLVVMVNLPYSTSCPRSACGCTGRRSSLDLDLAACLGCDRVGTCPAPIRSWPT